MRIFSSRLNSLPQQSRESEKEHKKDEIGMIDL
jgi:hypothetical protein